MPGPDWNPNTPDKLGVELLDVGYAHDVVDSPSALGILSFEALASSTHGRVDLYAGAGAQAAVLPSRYNDARKPMILDFVPEGDEATDDIIYNDFSPTSITGVATGMVNENGTAISVNRLTTLNDGLYIKSNVQGASFEVNFSGVAAYALTRHVLAVEVWAAINLTTGIRRMDPTGNPWTYNVPMYTAGQQLVSVRWGEAIIDGSATDWTTWTPAKVREFATAASRKVRISCQAGPGYWRIDRLWLRVYSITERRTGRAVGIPSAQGWIPFTLTNTDESSTMSLVNGDRYSALLRRITDYSIDDVSAATLPWRFMRGNDPGARFLRQDGSYDALTPGASARPAVLPPEPAGDGLPTFRLWNATGTSVSLESQPYELSRGAQIYDTQTAGQVLTSAGGTSYGQVSAVVGWRPTQGRPQGPLVCRVLNSSAVVVLGPVELTAAEVEMLPVSAPINNVDAEGVAYRTALFQFDSSAALAAGDYTVELSSPDSSSSRPWVLASLLGEIHTTDRTFGGTTQHAEGTILISGSPEDLETDWAADNLVQLLTVPPAVTGVAAEPDLVAAASKVAICAEDCAMHGFEEDIPVTRLMWSPAASGGPPSVVGYHVRRLNPRTEMYERVAYVDGRTTSEWVDHEPPLAVQTAYQVRSVRDDGVVGDWSDAVPVLIDVADRVGLYFTSNAATGMGCAYPQVWSGNDAVREWTEPAFEDVEFRRFYGRDEPVAFRPIERQGRGFDSTVLVHAGCHVANPSLRMFDPLADLCWAAVPYVCVRDTEGNVWYAAVQPSAPTNRRADPMGAELWMEDVRVTPVANVPAIADTSVAQVTEPVSIT